MSGPAGAPLDLRRLEVPVLVDGRGRAWAPGVLDATLIHRGRPVAVESPPVGLTTERLSFLLGMANGLARAARGPGAVTVSFLAGPGAGDAGFRFTGTAPGLPAAHAVLEALTGVDLPALETHLSRGGDLEGTLPEARGHAFQVCLAALDPETGFTPSPGTVENLLLPAGAGVRADAEVEEGAAPSADDGWTIARLTASGRSRHEALARLQAALARTVATLAGGATDKAFLAEVLDRPELHAGAPEPDWLDRLVEAGEHLPRRGAEAALLEAAILAHEEEEALTRHRFFESAARGRPEAPAGLERTVELGFRGHVYRLGIARLAPDLYRVRGEEGHSLEVRVGPRGRNGRRLHCGHRICDARSDVQGDTVLVEVDGVPHRIDRDVGCVVRSPAPAVVVSLVAEEGMQVAEGMPLAVVEAMKMETAILAPAPGRVRRILARPNTQVGAGAPLVVLDPAGVSRAGGDPEAGTPRLLLDLTTFGSPPLESHLENDGPGGLEQARHLMLGYDLDPAEVRRAAERAGLDEVRRLEDEVLRTYVDVASLFRREPLDGDPEDGGRRSTEEYLFTYLRDLDAEGAGLPASFLGRLHRALAEVRDLTPVRDAAGRVVQLPQFEHTLLEALAAIRRVQARRKPGERFQWNRVFLDVWPPVTLDRDELYGLARRLAPATRGLGLEKVVVRGPFRPLQSGETGGEPFDQLLELWNPGDGGGLALRFREPSRTPLAPLDEVERKVVELRRRGVPYAYEIVRQLAPSRAEAVEVPPGEFAEYDLDPSGRLAPVDRPPGKNTANVVAGVVRNFTERHPEGMARVLLLGDASRGMGALAEPECRRIMAALDLAEGLGVPLEWFALSAGAKISMESGTENMDWIARALRRIVEFTQAGGEINLVVPGINVGAQPYWNAEATMLMHTRGVLIMTPGGAMVLTGKQALDFSGGVSAEDNQGIGGYERIMGPNGQAQYLARDLGEACRILLAHYEHTYVAPGERFPRRAATADPRDRDVCAFPHGGLFRTLGDVFSGANAGRKKPFEIRKVLEAVADRDHPTLERWYGMRDAEVAVVLDAHLGGWPVCLLGFESKPLRRLGFVPGDGPDTWTGGTLFPQGSKKVARAINAASGNRPLVVLANLAGFDGSPESMRTCQLEYGAEIGRAVVNFRGPIVFCVVSRYHGGAFVVFSAALHDNMEVAALEGSYASVIGGAPAAAVVFAREVDQRTRKDPRVAALEREIADPGRPDKAALRARLEEVRETVRSEKLGEVAVEYDAVHDIRRAQRVGSVHRILPAAELRPYLIDAVERGMQKELERIGRTEAVLAGVS